MTEKREIVVVTWTDAHADTSWISEGDVDGEPYVVTSIGVSAGGLKPGHITIYQSQGVGTIDNVIHIPCGMVQEITVIGTIDVEV